jgi:hypothetical protein
VKDSTQAVAPLLAIAVLLLIPSSAVQDSPFGAFTPVLVALVIQLAGLLHARQALSWPPGFALIATVLVLAAIGQDAYSATLAPVTLLQYVLTWSASESARRSVRNGVIALASAEALIGIAEALLGDGPFIGERRVIDATNPFLPSLLRAQGTLGHPLVLALLLLVGLALTLAARDLGARIRFSASAALVLGSVFTGSTTTVIVAAAILVGFILLRAGIAVGIYSALIMAICVVGAAATGRLPAFLLDDLNDRTALHRLNSIASLPRLFTDRTVPEVFFGSPTTRELYGRNILISDGFFAVDNQFITTLALSGLIGALAGAVFLVGVALRTPERLMLVVYGTFLLTAASFDFLQWYAGSILFATALGLGQDARESIKTTPLAATAPAQGSRQRNVEVSRLGNT